ncbi:hypothetical protein [Nocardia sp. NPDC057030]|uniref:hypothetical protein n=1 Tax=unclassified Nocardia TaxID=2637762 RepID=UPI003624FC1B
MNKHEALNAANAEAARAAGWPELTGTVKQIGWATTVRADKMREFEYAAAAIPEREQNLFRTAMLREIRAGEWIDFQSQPWQAVAFTHLTADELASLGVTKP